MDVICVIKSVSPVRTLQGNQGEMKIVDVVVSKGTDELVFSAFDKVADRFTNGSIKEGSLLQVHLVGSVREKDGKYFQSLRCDQVGILYDPTSKPF